MRLSELVAGLGPTILTEIALVLFLASFAGILIYIAMRSNRTRFDEAKQLPFHDGINVGEQP